MHISKDHDAHNLKVSDNSMGLVICSNTLEHLHSPQVALKEFARIGQTLWLSWTPWWSPYGGHAAAPFHYLGLKGRKAGSNFGKTLFKTTVKDTLNLLDQARWEVKYIRPRYWPRLAFLAKWRLTREWATWNVEIYAQKKTNIEDNPCRIGC